MRNLSESEVFVVSGAGTVTPTNGGAGAAGPYSAMNGLSDAADAIGNAAEAVGDAADFAVGFIAGIGKGMWNEA